MKQSRGSVYITGLGMLLMVFSFTCTPSRDTPEPSTPNSEQRVERSQSAEGASVFIVEPIDGAIVSDSVFVKFGVKGMEILPAGTNAPNSGHFHLLVDAETLPPFDQPMGSQVLHFGKGQTETTLVLTPGPHTLQLMLGDKAHVPHDPPVIGDKISITVE